MPAKEICNDIQALSKIDLRRKQKDNTSPVTMFGLPKPLFAETDVHRHFMLPLLLFHCHLQYIHKEPSATCSPTRSFTLKQAQQHQRKRKLLLLWQLSC